MAERLGPDRLRALLDAYGAEPARWPAGEREAALALLEGSPEARALRDAAARLDRALDLAPAAEPSPALAARVLAAAPKRPRRRVAFLVPLAAAAALAFWLLGRPEPPAVPLTPAQIAALGTLTTPTDVLLAQPADLDLVDDLPALGCEEGALGCPDLDTPAGDRSDAQPTMRTLA